MTPSAFAACRYERKKCSDECLLVPCFPPDDLLRTMIVHQIYGISRVLKFLKDAKPEQRVDAVNSLVFEATARVKEPVYGCTREIHQLQRRIAELESQLATTQAELVNMCFTNDKPVTPFGLVLDSTSQQSEYMMPEEVDPLWEPLWKH